MSEEQETPQSDVFDLDRIRRLVELMEEHDLGQVDLRSSDQRIRLTRGSVQPTAFTAAPMPGHAAPPQAPAPSAPAAAGGASGSADALDGPHIVTIAAPMVGTFYARANPNAENFVKEGSAVSPDTTVCIIEAMKVFNEIPAEVRGKIVAVLVQNEEPVEFGKPLFKVDTSA